MAIFGEHLVLRFPNVLAQAELTIYHKTELTIYHRCTPRLSSSCAKECVAIRICVQATPWNSIVMVSVVASQFDIFS